MKAKTPASSKSIEAKKQLRRLALAALGVVYGDIGTSPLYSLKECFVGPYPVEPTAVNVLGICSLIFWSITMVVVMKYLSVLMRANNNGEGGIMALIALITPSKSSNRILTGFQKHIISVGLFGAALLYGDGVITPAISVLSAIEGLEVATPVFQPYIVPITVVVLIGLFLAQKKGTSHIGAIFGPTMVVWFSSIALLGLPWIRKQPQVLLALNPYYAVEFFLHNGFHGFLVLSAVVLCITGGEALYADMGHFGVQPIRRAWYRMVFPALILNYFGQGAMVLERGAEVLKNPFFEMVPHLLLYPMVVLATMATVIASQALISGAFSLTQQATQLGFLPRFAVVHTSEETEGQIYMPKVNQYLLISCIALVLTFGSSGRLAGAYGMAVTGTMMITSMLFYAVARDIWKWPIAAAASLTGFFLVFDIAFFASNLAKLVHGGWVPVLIAGIIFALMTTWRRGRRILSKEMFSKSMPLNQFLDKVRKEKPVRVEGTAVFMTPNPEIAPAVLLHHLRHNRVLHKRVLMLTIVTDHVPMVPYYEHGRLTELDEGIYQIVSHYGYLQTPNVSEILSASQMVGLDASREDLSFYLGRETLLTTGRSSMLKWRKKLFAFMSRNAQPATAFFGIPPERVIEVGLQLEV